MAEHLNITRKYPVLLPVLFAAVLYIFPTALNSETAKNIDIQAREISTHLMCPVCAGQSVAESNAQLAKDMRATIKQQLKEGKSKDQILAYFVQRYGDTILSSPPAKGFNILIWILPTAGIILIGFLLGNFLYKSKRPQEEAGKDEFERSKFKDIEDELKNYDI